MLPGMKFAVIARPPVVGGKVASFDASGGAEGAGRGEDREDRRATPAPAKFAAARRRRRHRAQHLGGIKGREALKIAWDDGPNELRLRTPTAPSSRQPRESPARSCATTATSTSALRAPPR